MLELILAERNRIFMKYIIIALLAFSLQANSQIVQYQKQDSVQIVRWLQDGLKQNKQHNMMLYFARELKGIPYVSKTLDVYPTERLVINTRQLDCTTFVENVLALYLCHKNKQNTFEDFCTFLRKIRYHNGQVSYETRLHYLTQWLESNSDCGNIKEVNDIKPPFKAIKKLNLYYMTTHPLFYPNLKNHKSLILKIKEIEKQLSGKNISYIPKNMTNNNDYLRQVIKDGDIIALVTNKPGLDFAHVGIAVWSNNGLHLINASSIHHRVIEDGNSLYRYLLQQRSQVGIKPYRVN